MILLHRASGDRLSHTRFLRGIMTRPNEVEWTHVGRRNGRLRHQPASHSREPPDVVVPNPEPSLTCADIRTAHGTLRREWRDSDACALLRQLLSDEADSLPAVSKAVCLGIGSFDPANGSWRARRTAHFQLEAFLSMVESLRTSRSTRSCCFSACARRGSTDRYSRRW